MIVSNDPAVASDDPNAVRHVGGLAELAPVLDLVICDLWGVMHNGVSVNDRAVDAISRLRDTGVASVFLSNAPRPRYHVRDQLMGMGMPETLTDYIVTSGGLARDAVRDRFEGAKLYHLGPDGDRNTVEGLKVEEVSDPNDAEVILATGLEHRDVAMHRDRLVGACEKQVPLLCANPDRVVHVGDKLFICAGTLADFYQDMGGPVEWFGKPTPESLQTCVVERGLDTATPGDRILMVGDSLQTDVAGANAAGFGSLFIAGGIHREEWPHAIARLKDQQLLKADFHKVFGEGKPVPTTMCQSLIW